jgi:hypothetical protein
MSKKIFFIFVLPMLLFSENSLYTIKLATYKNIYGLKNTIKKLPLAQQNEIQILSIGEMNKAFVSPTLDKQHLQQILPIYQTVFNDAFITTSQTISTSMAQQPTITNITERENILMNVPSLVNKIQNKTLYLCAYGKSVSNQKLLIRADFKKNTVIYHPILGNIPSSSLKYKIINKKLYVYKKGLYTSHIYSKLEQETSTYYLISSWIKKKKTTTIRYYFNEKDARVYLSHL